jgi:hypothetical protein
VVTKPRRCSAITVAVTRPDHHHHHHHLVSSIPVCFQQRLGWGSHCVDDHQSKSTSSRTLWYTHRENAATTTMTTCPYSLNLLLVDHRNPYDPIIIIVSTAFVSQ